MAKAVLVMDMPENCMECQIDNCGVIYNICGESRAEGCPLRELPEKDMETHFPDELADGYAAGWNDCIDAIVGEQK